MRPTFRFLLFIMPLGLTLAPVAPMSAQRAQNGGDFSQNPQAKPLPAGTILVKGAWAGASDSVTPLPEGGSVAASTYNNKYFAVTYPLPPGWTQKYYGPPPSDSGYYVLAQLRPAGTGDKMGTRGTILITAQDVFFALTPAGNALELMNSAQEKLEPDYKVERPLAPVSIANHAFVRFDYFSPVAQLHWYVLATQIRCHVVQFVFTSNDTQLLENLIRDLNKINLPAEASPILGNGGGDAPVCIKDYAREENIIERVDPVFTERRFNSIPVRIIIDKDGKVKHVHFLSAFPDQAKSITDALHQWRFNRYLSNGQPAEVETGIMFGRVPPSTPSSATGAVNE
jgi:hypothetical protein